MRQGARREAGAVILSSNCLLICMIGKNTLYTGIGGGPRKCIEAGREVASLVKKLLLVTSSWSIVAVGPG